MTHNLPWRVGQGLVQLALVGMLLVLVGAGSGARAGNLPILRITSENGPDHVQTRILKLFGERLQQRLAGRYDVRYFPSAQLFRDRDVVVALRSGLVEMAVPGTWQLDRHVPDVGVLFLPLFYGRGQEEIDKVRDGPLGVALSKRIEDQSGLKVLGPWIDLGFSDIFLTRAALKDKGPPNDYAALRGLAVRIPGGDANAERLRLLGMRPVIITWPDLPQQLDQGNLEGLVSTPETVASANLWDHGLAAMFEDHQYFSYYVPLMSSSFWQHADPQSRAILIQTWSELVGEARLMARQAQEQAHAQILRHGMRIFTPSPESLTGQRWRIMVAQDDLVLRLGIDPALVDMARREVGQ